MEGDYTDDPGVVIRNLRPEDCSRLVAIDEQITGRSRHLWYEGKLKRALEESDLQVSLGAESDGMLVDLRAAPAQPQGAAHRACAHRGGVGRPRARGLLRQHGL